MPGLENLTALLGSMDPELGSEGYVFVTRVKPAEECPGARPWAMIQEREGATLILEKSEADRYGMSDGPVFKRITLSVHSSLDAVGLTAAVATVLARAGISANVVAGYFHDHVFVQEGRADEALRLLEALSKESRQPA